MRAVLAARARHADLISDLDPATMVFAVLPDNPVVFAIVRQTRQGEARLIVLANSDYFHPQPVDLILPDAPDVLIEQLSGTALELTADHRLRLELAPGQVVWFDVAP